MTLANGPIQNHHIRWTNEPVASYRPPLGSAPSLPGQHTCSPEERQALMVLAEQVLADPIALQTVGDRVYALLQEEFRYCQEHRDTYDARFWR